MFSRASPNVNIRTSIARVCNAFLKIPHQIKTEAGETVQTQPGGQPYHPFKCEWANCHLAFESQSVHDQHVYIVHQNATIGNVEIKVI